MPAAIAGSGQGLAPRDAGVWLDLQRRLAWRPQDVAEPLREGRAPEAILAASGVGRSQTGSSSKTARELRRLEALGIRVVPLTDPAYPEPLAALTDAPPVLLVRGRVASLRRTGIAIVGARAATHAARATARRLARELAAAGYTIVSGLARGIDAEAHRGALDAAACTVGVLACGPDRIYPPEHRRLAEEMMSAGAVVSEMPVGVPPRRVHFPLRNRIISGLCRAVIVVEARRRSGSLITVRHALEQGREVFVVPGSIEGPFAEGSNQLLRDGARPIRSARDVLEDIGRPDAVATAGSGGPGSTRLPPRDPGSLGTRILRALESGPTRREDLLIHADFEPAALATVLLELELVGQVVEDRDGRIHATWR